MYNFQHKIFGIGLNKTGTSTLAECGRIMNLRCTSCDSALLRDVVINRDLTNVRSIVNEFDLFEDWPWPLIYKELDQMYPGSKFILTIRKDSRIWLESLKNHSMRTHPTNHCRKYAYGYNFPHLYEEEHIAIYNQHNKDVNDYFMGRTSDFIELCWERGDGWRELCSFLNKDIPNAPFPHANKGSSQHIDKNRYVMNQLLSRILR